MKLSHLIYSKCPHCHEHGIPAFKLRRGIIIEEECRYCHKKIYIHPIATWSIYFIAVALVAWLCNTILSNLLGKNVSNIIFWTVSIIMLYLAEYFAIYEKVEDDEDDS